MHRRLHRHLQDAGSSGWATFEVRAEKEGARNKLEFCGELGVALVGTRYRQRAERSSISDAVHACRKPACEPERLWGC